MAPNILFALCIRTMSTASDSLLMASVNEVAMSARWDCDALPRLKGLKSSFT